jgi:hypothetical protein
MKCLTTKIMWLSYKLDPIVKVKKPMEEKMRRMHPKAMEFFTLE